MRILVVSNLYPPMHIGGYEMGCRTLVDALRQRGHDVRVLTSPSTRQADQPQPHVVRSLQMTAHTPAAMRARRSVEPGATVLARASHPANTAIMLQHIEEFEPECVYLFNVFGIGGLALMDALRVLHQPWALHLMDRVPVEVRTDLDPDVLALFGAHDGSLYDSASIISMSRRLLGEIEQLCGYSLEEGAVYVPGWSTATRELPERDHAPGGRVRFVAAGRVHANKGTGLILEAAARLRERVGADFALDIYGDGDLPWAVDLAHSLGLDDLVRFGGWRSQAELQQIYRRSDAFLFPTWEREPFGFAPVEAAAEGCVPIITGGAGVTERMVDGVHCVLIDRTADSLADAMQRVCDGAVDLAAMSEAGMILCREDLHLDTCVSTVEDVLASTARQGEHAMRPDWRTHALMALKHNLAQQLQES
jgi:glycosyltransferase involved in cell wall biosynthesis